MPTSKGGAAKMHGAVARAFGDIKHRLWSLYWLVRMTRETGMVVELGVRGGHTTWALLAGCEDAGSALFSFDVEDCSWVGETYPGPIKPCWYFKKSSSAEAGLSWRRKVDLVFVDTDHRYQTTQAEIAAWQTHVRVGGCLVFHDYWLHDPPRDEHQGHGVKMAVDEFADLMASAWELETHDAGPDGDTGMALLWRRR